MLGIVLTEQIVPGTGQAVAADTAINLGFVLTLPVGAQPNNTQARCDLIGNNRCSRHPHHSIAVNGHCAGEVANIGCFPAAWDQVNAEIAHGLHKGFAAVNQGFNNLAWAIPGITVNGVRYENVIGCTNANQVIKVHHNTVLRGAVKDSWVTRFFVVQIRQDRFGPTAIGVNDVTVIKAAAEDVGRDLAKTTWEESAIKMIDNGVNVLLLGADAARHIARRGAGWGGMIFQMPSLD